MKSLVGRKEELSILKDAFESVRPELIAVTGRRRIGKTFLIREAYKKKILFEFTAIHKGTYKQQLSAFTNTCLTKCKNFKKPENWVEAFYLFSQCLDSIRSGGKKIIFFDEFPWFDTRRSGFLPAFDHFWNNYASKRDDLIVVICGSAVSYMIQKIIKNKGDLHNRTTRHIRLYPFNLYEAEQLLKRNNIRYTRYDLLQIYMAFGGVPYYLEHIRRGESVAQAIDRLCFSKNGLLRSEFNNVLASLFDLHEHHESIIRILVNTRKGLTRNKILKMSRIKSGGTLSKVLRELEES